MGRHSFHVFSCLSSGPCPPPPSTLSQEMKAVQRARLLAFSTGAGGLAGVATRGSQKWCKSGVLSHGLLACTQPRLLPRARGQLHQYRTVVTPCRHKAKTPMGRVLEFWRAGGHRKLGVGIRAGRCARLHGLLCALLYLLLSLLLSLHLLPPASTDSLLPCLHSVFVRRLNAPCGWFQEHEFQVGH